MLFVCIHPPVVESVPGRAVPERPVSIETRNHAFRMKRCEAITKSTSITTIQIPSENGIFSERRTVVWF